MATNTAELKGKISIKDMASKELKKLEKELKNIKKASKDLDKSFGKKKNINADASKAKKAFNDASKKAKEYEKTAKGLNPEIKTVLKDLASGSIKGIKDKLGSLTPLAKIPLKLIGAHPILSTLFVIGVALGKLIKSAYNDVKVRLHDMTQWGIQKIKQGLASLKDKVIKVSIEGYDQYSDYKARAKSIKKGMGYGEYEELMHRTAKNTRSSLQDTRAGITKLMQMSPEVFGGKAKDASKFYQTAIQSFRRGGSSSQEASAAMYQLNQGLASGTLQGDELRSVRENAPLLAKMIEKEVGTGIKEAGQKGLLTSEVVTKAVLKHADEVNKEFQNIPLNFKDAWVMTNELLDAKVFTPMYERMGKIFSNPAVQTFFADLYAGAEKAIDGLWKLLDDTNFGGIDFSKLQSSFAPLGDFIKDIYNHIVSGSPEAQEAINTLGDVVNNAFEGMGDVFLLFRDIAKDIFQFLKDNPEFIKNVIKLLAAHWRLSWNMMSIKLRIANAVILPILRGIIDAVSGIVGAVKSVISWWDNMISKMKSTNFSGFNGLDGFQGHGGSGGDRRRDSLGRPRAMGQATIPYDNYPIRAHQGERLLNKREANEYLKTKGNSSNVNIHIDKVAVRDEADIDLIAGRLVRKMQLAKAGGA